MTPSDTEGLRHDLAFLRAIAEGGNDGGDAQRGTGKAFVAGGVLYAVQCFAFAAQAFGLVVHSQTFDLVMSIAPTAIFLPVLGVIVYQHREETPGVVSRALAAAFGAAGTATFAMLVCFVIAILQRPSLETWLLFPCTVFALHGAAWLVAWAVRKRTWLGCVAAGWLVSAVGLAATIGSPWYPVIAGLALLLLMALPGAYMLRRQSN